MAVMMENENDKTTKIAIISDLHVMAPKLLVNDGKAFLEYLNRDRKMLHSSKKSLNSGHNSCW